MIRDIIEAKTVAEIHEKVTDVFTRALKNIPQRYKGSATKTTAPTFVRINGVTDDYFTPKAIKAAKKVINLGSARYGAPDKVGSGAYDSDYNTDICYIYPKDVKKLTQFLVSAVDGVDYIFTAAELKKQKPYDPDSDYEDGGVEYERLSLPGIIGYDLTVRADGSCGLGCKNFTVAQMSDPTKRLRWFRTWVSATAGAAVLKAPTIPNDYDEGVAFGPRNAKIRYEAFVAAAPFITQIHARLQPIKKPVKKAAKKTTAAKVVKKRSRRYR